MSGAQGLLVALGVAVAGGFGAALRHLIDSSLPARVKARFPLGIMLINLTGSFVLGLLTGLALDSPWAAIIGTGLLGGYTTFSTATLDTVNLLRQKHYGAALLNGLGMLIAGVALAVLGVVLARALVA